MAELNAYEQEREERIRKNREELQRLTGGLRLTAVRAWAVAAAARRPRRAYAR